MSINDFALHLGQALQKACMSVTTAESCTGGGIAEAITRVSGSSQWFDVGFITYSNNQKTKQLGVPEAVLLNYGAVSREVVEFMARGAQLQSNAEFAVAVSGIAGPSGGTSQKPVGTVWIAWAAHERLCSACFHFEGDRLAVREQVVERALLGLVNSVTGKSPLDD